MQGIATLDPRMATPPAPQAANPMANLPPEIASQVNQTFGNLDPSQVEQFNQLAKELDQFLPEELQALLDILNYLRENRQRYPQAVQELISQGKLSPGDVPDQFEPVYFSVLINVIKQKLMQKSQAPQAAPAAFAQGGLASLAQQMAAAGRNGDNMLAHITPTEMRYLQRVSGKPTVNPVTGLPEFSFLGSVGNFLKKAATVVLPIALSFTPLGPIAGAAVGSGLASLINGGRPADALKSALIGGAAGAVLSGVSGSLSADSAFRPFLPDVGAAAGQGFMAGVQAGLPGGLGLSGQYAMERSMPSWLGGSGEAARTIGGAAAPGVPAPVQGELPKALYATPDEYAGAATTTTAGGTTTANVTPPGVPGAPPAQTSAMESVKNFFMPSNPTTAQVINSADYKALVGAGISPTEAFKTVSTQMTPGFLAKYGPMAAVGIGALALGGAFKTPQDKRQPVAEARDFQGKTSQELLAENPSKYQVANLNPYQYVPNNPNFTAQSQVVSSPSYTQVQAQRPIANVPNLTEYFYGRAQPFYAAKGGITDAAEYKRMNGHISGPGTGTSDSIPAKLSDGEFVMTAKAVRNAGGGDRLAGAKKMYQLMRELEARG